VSTSPSYTFLAQADRALVVNFVAVGAACAISTSSLPGHGGATTGDGAYALGSSATVSATAGPGYKFSKWLENGAVASLRAITPSTSPGTARSWRSSSRSMRSS